MARQLMLLAPLLLLAFNTVDGDCYCVYRGYALSCPAKFCEGDGPFQDLEKNHTLLTGQRYYNSVGRSFYSRDLYEHGRSLSDNLVTCGPHTCGQGAHCIHGSVRPVCACLPGYSGDPLTQCVRIECVDNSECRSHQTCVNQHCVDPCAGTCGTKANCDVRNHIPVCSCPPGYTGNPFSFCKVADPEEACHPSPCGVNTKCHVANNQAICTCLPGFRGSPLSGCRHECESDADCSHSQSCRDFKCVSPCGDCGVNADCETVASHRAVCKCPRGYLGDPYRGCFPECSSDSECPSYKPACIYNACVDPCINACGVNAECHLRGLTPVCSCPRNMTGDPFTFCRPFEARDLCEPNPCGTNAKCTPGHDRTGAERPVCTCPVGHIGNALVACERGECELDSQCHDHLACVGYRCVDPCLGNSQCGSGAVCMARRHLAVCTCPNANLTCEGPTCPVCDAEFQCTVRGKTIICYCPPNYAGDPLVACYNFSEARRKNGFDTTVPVVTKTMAWSLRKDICKLHVCGTNAICTPQQDLEKPKHFIPVCTCPIGYIGNPMSNCIRGECDTDDNCTADTACVGYRCVDPCHKQCGIGAVCFTWKHRAVCRCAQGLHGNPLTLCVPKYIPSTDHFSTLNNTKMVPKLPRTENRDMPVKINLFREYNGQE